MTEVSNAPSPVIRRDVPDFETNWKKTKDLLPFWGWKEETLDSLNICWQSIPAIEDRLSRLEAASLLPNLPEKELKVAVSRLEASTKQLDGFVAGITLISNNVPDDIKWQDVKVLAETADELNGEAIGNDEQATALLEEINELQDSDKLPANYEQVVAEGSFDELLRTMQFDIHEYTAADDEGEEMETERTTQDPVEEEKSELQSWLKKKAWTPSQVKGARVGYLALLRLIRSDGNDVPEELQNDVKKLWKKAAKNEGPKSEGALDVLELTEYIYKTLKDNGALDINLNDLVAEEEEMEEED